MSVTHRMPKELNDRLNEAAEARTISANLLVVKLIEQGLDRLAPVAEATSTNGA